MKSISIRILMLVAGLFTTSCDVEEIILSEPERLISEITTGTASVTAVAAEVTGTVKDLSLVSSASYEAKPTMEPKLIPSLQAARKAAV